jgi:hypothetical protein
MTLIGKATFSVNSRQVTMPGHQQQACPFRPSLFCASQKLTLLHLFSTGVLTPQTFEPK